MAIRRYFGDVSLSFDSGITDIIISENDLLRDETFKTAILTSVLSDARKEESALVGSDLRGWWPDNSFGSLLWILDRAKTEDGVLSLAEEQIRLALAWLITEGITDKIDVVVKREKDILHIFVTIYRPTNNNNPTTFKFFYNWQAQLS